MIFRSFQLSYDANKSNMPQMTKQYDVTSLFNLFKRNITEVKKSVYNIIVTQSNITKDDDISWKSNTYSVHELIVNTTPPETYISSTFDRGFTTSAHVGIVLCSIGIFFNLLLIILLCSSKKLRWNYLYCQILSITIADLGFITLVDSFTVYYELHPWSLGAAFCKAWMILDGALPSVALLALLLLNVDRVLYTYKTKCYHRLMTQAVLHVILLLTPWCVSCSIVCSLWLGFPAVQPLPNVCMYGITAEAHTASSWLTVFLPSMIILVLLIFVFIAVIGEMPAIQTFGPIQLVPTSPATNNDEESCDLNTRTAAAVTEGNMVNSSDANESRSRRQRRFVTALLAVDFVSLAITLPFSAFSLVSPKCEDVQSCDSLMILFQTLSWMRSSVSCLRPCLFILFTDIFQSSKEHFIQWYFRHNEAAVEYSSNLTQGNPSELILLTRFKNSYNLGSRTNSISTTLMTPPQSPFPKEPPVNKMSTFSSTVRADSKVTYL